MKNLKKLSRDEMKNVLGGDLATGECGTVQSCSTGACSNGNGTCGLSSHGTKCTCATVTVGN